jgi:aldehyde dehydrogenase (NAD+)
VAEVALLSPDELQRRISAAEHASAEWSRLAATRSAALHRWAASLEADGGLPDLLAREVGKPLSEARAEVARSVAILRYYAQAAYDPVGEVFPSPDGRAELRSERLPLGVVLVITPWNFPAAIPIWKIAPALAYGNAVIFKPASAAVGTAERLSQLAHRSVPQEVLQLATIGSEQVGQLLDDDRIAGVSFTGSVEVGRTVIDRVSGRGGAVQAEMGGQNPSVVLDDADVGVAARTIAGAAMAYAGQKCTATSRVIVASSIADEFVPALLDAVRGMPIGDPLDEATMVGPLISESALNSVDEAVSAATKRGAELLTGGRPASGEGWFYDPALLRVADISDPFVQEETFGPAAAVMLADDDEQTIAIANSTRFGLSAAVFGADTDRAWRVARRLRSGLVRVNASTTGVDFYAPFGGDKDSSYGPREQGKAAREFYTQTRTIFISPAS